MEMLFRSKLDRDRDRSIETEECELSRDESTNDRACLSIRWTNEIRFDRVLGANVGDCWCTATRRLAKKDAVRSCSLCLSRMTESSGASNGVAGTIAALYRIATCSLSDLS
ncbi:hypothetical protein HN011_011853 [Eciton burchellii]|nr:hypothetical protein HN011_011853 [Eciton burchellii]